MTRRFARHVPAVCAKVAFGAPAASGSANRSAGNVGSKGDFEGHIRRCKSCRITVDWRPTWAKRSSTLRGAPLSLLAPTQYSIMAPTARRHGERSPSTRWNFAAHQTKPLPKHLQ